VPSTGAMSVIASLARLSEGGPGWSQLVAIVPGTPERWLIDGMTARAAGAAGMPDAGMVAHRDCSLGFSNAIARAPSRTACPCPAEGTSMRRAGDAAEAREGKVAIRGSSRRQRGRQRRGDAACAGGGRGARPRSAPIASRRPLQYRAASSRLRWVFVPDEERAHLFEQLSYEAT